MRSGSARWASSPAGSPATRRCFPGIARRCRGSWRRTATARPAFGKWHLTPDGQQGPAGPFDRWPTGWGFDYFYGFLGGGRRAVGPVPGREPEDHRHSRRVLRREPSVLLARRDGGQDHRVAPRRPRPGRRKPFFAYFSTGCSHAPHHVAESGRTSTRASSTRAGTGCARRPSPGRRQLGVVPTTPS